MLPSESPVIEPFEVPLEKRPRHIGIIMDGNGRWAQRQGLPRIEGHRRGAATVRRVVEECSRLGAQQLTLYCLSIENWKRPPEEIDFLMQLLQYYMVEERESIQRNNVRLSVVGRREGLPAEVLRTVDESCRAASNNSGPCLCLAINYSGRAEIVDAVRRIAAKVRDGELRPDQIDEAAFQRHLYSPEMPDVDLLVRTAGEMRISNFLLWQISYAELWVTDRCWPEFDELLLREAIRDYARRTRRFGGLIGESAKSADRVTHPPPEC